MKSDFKNITGYIYLNKFAKYVFNAIGIKEWRIEFLDSSFCANDLKFISISKELVENQPNYYLKEMFLHEVAHIGDNRNGSIVTHDADFFKRFGNYCIKFAEY